jgi:hypothetical protein
MTVHGITRDIVVAWLAKGTMLPGTPETVGEDLGQLYLKVLAAVKKGQEPASIT